MSEVKSKKYVASLADAMTEAAESDDRVVVLGQGVTDFKRLFGSTAGMMEEYPERVIETPIAEDSIAGICIGLALGGMYPINTHIRADFGLLIFNQLINLAAKYKYMFGGLFEVPMMVRLIIGRSWGQGAQHSQSLQSMLAHVPGLTVVMPSHPNTIEKVFKESLKCSAPVVVLEHRLLYELEFSLEDVGDSKVPGLHGSWLRKKGCDVTIVTASVMVLEVMRAANLLAEMGVDAEVIDIHSISHPDEEMIVSSVVKTGRLLVVDTSWEKFGLGAEVARILVGSKPSALLSPMSSLGMAFSPCPTAKSLEDLYYPDVREIIIEILRLVERDPTELDIPPKQSMTDFYKHFKGPF